MTDVTFEVVLTTVDGKPYTCGPVSIGVIVGDDDARPGEGVVAHKHAGLWRYYPADHEIGPFKTVVAFSAHDVVSGFDRRQGATSPPVPPANLDGLTAITRTQFLEWTAGHLPRKNYEFWLAQLLQADPVPLTDPIKLALQTAYPHAFK